MKKEEMIEIVDDLIKIAEKSLDPINNAIKKCVDSPRIVSMLSDMHRERSGSIAELKNLKKDIENHRNMSTRMDAMFGMPTFDDGIVLDEEGEE